MLPKSQNSQTKKPMQLNRETVLGRLVCRAAGPEVLALPKERLGKRKGPMHHICHGDQVR
jgi:hypothetical protein